jgi:hypothetical protein
MADVHDMAISNFIPSVAPDAAGAFVDRTVPKPDRRRNPRRMILRDGLLTPAAACEGQATARVVVVDMSVAGVGMRMRENPEPGTVFWLSVPALPELAQARVRVVQSRPTMGQQYDVGAEFC